MRGDEQPQERRIFGTDGVRGLANKGPLAPDQLLRLGMAAGRHFRRGQHRHRVVIGKDTRLSGYMIEPALTAGFIATGMDVILLGPLPTPATALMTRSMRADLGVMISASHNPYHDNGIKFFGPDGFKLSDTTELTIERLMEDGAETGLCGPENLGRASRIDDAGARYIEFAKSTLPRRLSFEGLRIVLDCAHGAAYKVAPTVLYELGAEVKSIGVNPDGFNINRGVGSTDPLKLQDMVLEYRADIGIALDGDADRVIMCDENGKLIDGDQILAAIATSLAEQDLLRGGGVVSTVMSNIGFELYLKKCGLDLTRTKVGDRYVVEQMRARDINVGGEPSGHVVLSDYTSTGDGLITALQILGLVAETEKPVSEVCSLFEPFPSVLKNVRFTSGDPLAAETVKAAIAEGKALLGGEGRTVIRKSGTEPVIRVMAEGPDAGLVERVVDDICDAIEQTV
ncbi:phosphoglucomutase/phosphomannomutase family protein [Parvularcula bermudensis HTCC2503]|uniref:Phosphoglucosamine mutase n=1 Tax=Parvularcula bermudensis (strain ATCC BAA-594 / HTCC2503 / KCTC 12087) TaxID=314260 RepID=E0TID9_PARBH|nr:phosphoglucosamine mutase [Parvularcula bermudensis]ADM09723.1 phosphoglucomutase/phosphomannomutase family protein [Parvularcula bermudensis HTCC2503]